MNMKYLSWMYVSGGILLLLGCCSYITGWKASPYVYGIGAVLFAVPQLLDRYEGANFIIRRLRRQQILGALLLMMTTFFMVFFEHNEWILCLTIAAVLELYTSFRISAEEKKEQQNGERR